jgi:hypothetical protein
MMEDFPTDWSPKNTIFSLVLSFMVLTEEFISIETQKMFIQILTLILLN